MAIVEHEESTFLTWRMVADELAEALRLTREYVGEDKLPAMPGWSWYEATKKYNLLRADDEESNMIAHARRELELAKWFEKDPDGLHPEQWAESLIAAVAEVSHYGHSGGTIGFAVGMLEDLIMFRPLTPLTNNPEEWQDVTEYMDGTQVWQNRRDGRMFSYDRGKTWHSVEDPRWHKRRSPLAWLWRRKIRGQKNRPLKPSSPETVS